MQQAPPGPIAQKVINALRSAQASRVVQLGAVRAARASAIGPQFADLHPAHACYAQAHDLVAQLAMQLAALPATVRIAQRIEQAEQEYVPGWPPLSPVSNSFFTTWAAYDAAAGLKRETLGSCVLAIGRALGLDPGFLGLVRALQHSRPSVFLHEGVDGSGHTLLRDLANGNRATCTVASGWTGQAGELWLARVLPAPSPELPVCTVLTTPYVLQRTTEADWQAYFQRTLGPLRIDPGMVNSVLKHQIDWLEYLFAGYAGHTDQAIFLTGLPDQPETLPHYNPRRLFRR